jgi:NADH:ubiquinone oxidoreductase subunit F (NADH-binding)
VDCEASIAAVTKRERRLILKNCGRIDPESIEDYISAGNGYAGLSQARRRGAAAVREELSPFLGRIGEGWSRFVEAEDPPKYLVCNGLDYLGGADVAGRLFRSDPHSVLEGTLTLARASGADHCLVLVAEDEELGRARLETALRQAAARGLVAAEEVEIKTLPRALIAAEPTAVVRHLNGRQMLPYTCPPYPEQEGVEGRPTLFVNPYTCALVAAALRPGGEKVDTALVDLSLDGEPVATVELPAGTPAAVVVEELLPALGDRRLAYVRVGGVLGRYCSPEQLDFGLEGVTSLALFTAGRCPLVGFLEDLSLLHRESCGLCVFCREGTYQIEDMMRDILEGGASRDYPNLLRNLAEQMGQGSVCSLGRRAGMTVVSGLELFAEEINRHLERKGCSYA